ncbi:ceramide synthase isoform X5 [Columba livia]|uniref:ceramide synthase isoform X5 n=1 Tax=Columba livia TaxID=8932 RepID=UPI0031BB768B
MAPPGAALLLCAGLWLPLCSGLPGVPGVPLPGSAGSVGSVGSVGSAGSAGSVGSAGSPVLPFSAGLLFFPGLFVLGRCVLRRLRCPEPHAEILAARLVSSVQAVMASTAGYIISSSCHHVIDDQHWLASWYPPFAVPYFIYDVYAMFLCHRHRARVKGHEEAAAPAPLRRAALAFLRRDPLMVLHHAAMVLVCFPVATLQLQHTLLHRVNALLLLGTFLLCRVLLFPFLYWAYGRARGVPFLGVPLALPPQVNAAAAALLAPQLYWFLLICRGAWRLLRPRPGTPTGTPTGTPRDARGPTDPPT